MGGLLSLFAVGCGGHSFFLIPPWYEYLNNHISINTYSHACELNVNFISGGKLDLSLLTLVFLAILDMLLRVAALVAVGFIIYAGFQYITAQGEPEKAKHALGTIINASIGLGITIVAAASVRFIGEALGGAPANSTNPGSVVDVLPQTTADQAHLQTITNIVFGIFAAVALLILVISGLRYVTANGDPNAAARSRRAIIFTSIGLLVTLLAFAIVSFIIGNA
ncbi:MAG TPA: hypothetical protein VLF91_01790 [Candidatus Saccharimonadales bacterium]|nr:hypothetical protein [Candidatus Saccharimonadales bacterium]